MTDTTLNRIATDTNNPPVGPGQEPLMTGDGVLAFALHMAGTPFVDDDLWVINYYTPEILRKLYPGLSMREGAKQAVVDGRPGVIRFLLAKPDIAVLQAYNDQQREIKESDGEAQDVPRNLFEDYKSGVRSYGETAARVTCLLLKMRIAFMNGWKDVVPLLRIDDNRAPQQRSGLGGEQTVELGGFKFISVNASEKTRERLGL